MCFCECSQNVFVVFSVVEVSLEAQSTTVKEGNPIELTVTKLGEANIPVSVLLFTEDVTAKGKQI